MRLKHNLGQVTVTNMSRLAGIVLLVLCISGGLFAQPAQTPATAGSPEEGFVSRSKYTNAFFGFSMVFPQSAPLRSFELPSRGNSHYLFGMQTQAHGLSVFSILAVQSGTASSGDARKSAAGPKGEATKHIEISGKEFWKSDIQEKKGKAGKMRTVTYAVAQAGYVLEFHIISFDSKFTEDLERSVESIMFFDPAKAREMAGADSQPFNPAAVSSRSSGRAVPHSSGGLEKLSAGSVTENNYTNEALGFSYQFPEGWQLIDKATQEKVIERGHERAWGDSPSAAREHEVVQRCMKVLLWANKYPEGTPTKEVNPLIVVYAADPGCFPGARFPASSKDEETIRDLARGVAKAFQGTPLAGQGGMKVSTHTVEGHLFVEISSVVQANVPGRPAPVELHNAMAFTPAHDFWVMWIYSCGSDAELQELKNTKIAFLAPSAAP